MNYVTNEIHFIIAYLRQRGSRTQAIFMYYWMNSQIFMHNGLTFGQFISFTQVFIIPYGNLEYTNAVTVHCGKVGCGMAKVLQVR